ncbi:GNAT family N-acetyltransferase [Desemzia sp. FAM 23991]|uniref:GNAT family N-acetyltransferase n=1 Tax=unclassified Desemzia TaxID=2685243 RepID=UPI003883D2CD
MKFEWTTDLESITYTDALSIRKKVFVEEQKVPMDLEIDELEDKTLHVVGYSNHAAVATARMYEKSPKTYKIQRVAVDSDLRGQQLGAQLMHEVGRYAAQLGGEAMVLDAQDYAIPFYEKIGFQITDSEGFMDAGIPHHSMKKELHPSEI